MINRFAICLLLLVSQTTWSIQCFFTLVKDNCWLDYDVTVNVTDAITSKPVLTITVPKGKKSWERKTFDCQPLQSLDFVAKFSPIFWESDKGKTFKGKRTWTLPVHMEKGDTAWNITVCYPEQFTAIPLPPTAGSNCACDTKAIPEPVVPK